jgi:hypothetical protein
MDVFASVIFIGGILIGAGLTLLLLILLLYLVLSYAKN